MVLCRRVKFAIIWKTKFLTNYLLSLIFVCTNEINNVLKQETPFMIFDINNLNETLQKKNNYATYVVILD